MVRTMILDRNVLFLCSDNACLSVIAEAISKSLSPPGTSIFSAGVTPRAVDSKTAEALQEWGLDISAPSKGLETVAGMPIDLIVGLGRIDVATILFPRARWEHWSIADPRESPAPGLAHFHRTVNLIDARVNALFLDHWRNLAGAERAAYGA